jgi:hypothetical protein
VEGMLMEIANLLLDLSVRLGIRDYQLDWGLQQLIADQRKMIAAD